MLILSVPCFATFLWGLKGYFASPHDINDLFAMFTVNFMYVPRLAANAVALMFSLTSLTIDVTFSFSSSLTVTLELAHFSRCMQSASMDHNVQSIF